LEWFRTIPVLQGLIAESLKNNYDVKIAADHVIEQEAHVSITKGGEYPLLGRALHAE
jgi:outer membrane protein, multidrug efflux system